MNYRDVLAIKPFRDLWLGQAISQIGDALYYTSFMFMVKKVTGSNDLVGYTGAMEALPYLVFGAQAGVLADRIDRKRIMLSSDVLCAIALLLFAVCVFATKTPPGWSFPLVAFVLSSIRCFFMPAKSAAIPALVPANILLRANSLSFTTQTLVPMLGLAVSATVMGVLYLLSPTGFFVGIIVVNAISFLFSAMFIARLPKIEPIRAEAVTPKHPWLDFREGLSFIRRRHDLKVILLMISLFRLSASPFFVVYVVINDVWWGGPAHHGTPQTLAAVELTFFVGMVISSLYVGRFKAKHPAQWFCYGLAIVGVIVALMAYSRPIWVFCTLNFIAGLGFPLADLPINTYLQLSVEDGYRGRVNSVLNMVASIAPPMGMALSGRGVNLLGLTPIFWLMGLGMVGSAAYGLLDRPLRNAVMPESSETT